MPCSRYARQTGAVPSGRSVSERPPWSVNVYISLRTMSVASPTVRTNSSVSSKIGVSIWPKPAPSTSALRLTEDARTHAGLLGEQVVRPARGLVASRPLRA